ncbi:KilA-N domain-containing protein [Streptococcus suis]|uniref:KilA-N domain-containing protein n=1 Tax=Streptococcus suis TaxID=1307 RepID=UPI000C187A9B|nr:KilA-N domain-containing protein [Streptococcus suis]
MVKIKANGKEITLLSTNTDYVSLTDIAKYRNPDAPADIIKNWMRSRNTIEFLGAWEKINNENHDHPSNGWFEQGL